VTDDYEEKLSQLEAALLESSAQAAAAVIAANATVHVLQADMEAAQSRVRVSPHSSSAWSSSMSREILRARP
jgi:hypothetical protein